MAVAHAYGRLTGMEIETTDRLCVLALRADRREVCPGSECPLWEDGDCGLERLAADGELYIDACREEWT